MTMMLAPGQDWHREHDEAVGRTTKAKRARMGAPLVGVWPGPPG